ncbi:MAG: OadG family protein [Ruminococcaceae bacterium]|nr:OadG family protein [Oscillospiraceae bacterium]
MNIAFGLLSESGNVIDRLQGYTDNSSQTIAQQQVADPDYWSSVGIISLTGILVVFLILAILIFFFWLMGTIFRAVDKSKAAKMAAAESVKAAPAPVVETVEEISEDNDDEEVVAVISAAIAAYAEAEGTSLTITGIKKRRETRTRSAWSMAGINDNIGRF